MEYSFYALEKSVDCSLIIDQMSAWTLAKGWQAKV
jgi:hypothetical protein